jgi:hypothetical protein
MFGMVMRIFLLYHRLDHLIHAAVSPSPFHTIPTHSGNQLDILYFTSLIGVGECRDLEIFSDVRESRAESGQWI